MNYQLKHKIFKSKNASFRFVNFDTIEILLKNKSYEYEKTIVKAVKS